MKSEIVLRTAWVGSRSASADESRVQTDVADVVGVGQPADKALKSESISSVWHTSVLPLVHVPEVVLRVDSGLLERGKHLIFLPDTH